MAHWISILRNSTQVHELHDISLTSSFPRWVLLVIKYSWQLTSLFLVSGTGNATPHLPTIMMERLYTSPTYGMWYPIDPKSLSSNLPPMVVFPEETEFYSRWQRDMESRGVKVKRHRRTTHVIQADVDKAHSTQVRLNTELTRIISRSKSSGVGVTIRSRREQPDGHNPEGADGDLPETAEHFDELVLCCLADTSKRLLGNTAGPVERGVLGSAEWSDDVTVTHTVGFDLQV